MPKRLVDGEALWRSNKLNQVQPLNFRAEYANLIPLAEADGTFEADPRRVWADVYSFNRPDVRVGQVEDILKAFEKAGMLVRKTDENGKIWGKFMGIETRLPAKSLRGRYKQGKADLFNGIDGTQDKVKSASRGGQEVVLTGLDRFGLDRFGLEGNQEAVKVRSGKIVLTHEQQAVVDRDKREIEESNERTRRQVAEEAALAALSEGKPY
jgi:hypothetical protein